MPATRLLVDIGRCHGLRGDLPRALKFAELYAAQVDGDEELEVGAEDLLDVLRGRLKRVRGKLTIKAKPKVAEVTLRGVRTVVGETPMSVWIEPGTWELTVGAEGFLTHSTRVVISVGEDRERTVELESPKAQAARKAQEDKADKELKAELEAEDEEEQAADAAAAEAARVAAEEAKPPGDGDEGDSDDVGGPDLSAVVALGAGAALLFGGGVYGLLASQADDELTAMKAEPHSPSEVEDQHATATSHQNLALALTAGGLVAAGAGIALWMMDASDGPEPTGAGLRWTF